MPRHAHLVGSVGLADAETVFTTVADILGPTCVRIPDGETGERGYWIRWQRGSFADNPQFEVAETTRSLPGFKDSLERTFFKIKDGVAPEDLDMGALGYAAEATESYALFAKLQDAGKIAPDTRFQVSLPTPMALICGFVAADDRLKVEAAIEAALLADAKAIEAAIPAERLTIQWDVCYEVVGSDGGPPVPYDDPVDGSIARVVRLCDAVSPDVELGIHLCYGDPGHKHVVDPNDLRISVAFANGIANGSARRVDYIHMPVMRERDDDAFFAPLAGLALPAETTLVLGLVHHTGGVEGSRKRMATADKFVTDYDIATECGFGRRDPATIPELLHIHRQLCD